MVAAAITGGDVLVENVITNHIKPVIAKLKESGAEVIEEGENVRVIGRPLPEAIDIKTLPYPGFPTDMQAQFMAYMTQCKGSNVAIETVFENRFMHVEEFEKMGADIKIDGRSAVVIGPKRLHGAHVHASDLRAGAALILVGLVAEGKTHIHDIYHIDRGYEDIEEKFRNLGAVISRVESEEI